MRRLLLNYLDIRDGTILPKRRSAEPSQTENVSPAKKENSMLVDLHGRSFRRHRLLFTCLAIVPTLMILTATVSCSRPDMPEPRVRVVERNPPFSGRVTDAANLRPVQPTERQPKVRRQQPRTSASPKVATIHTPKATKANTPPRLDTQREQQLFREFQEFLEWRRRQKGQP